MDAYPHEQAQMLADVELKNHVGRVQKQFVEQVINDADTQLVFDTFDTDAIVDALHEVANAGYPIDERDDDYSPPLCFAHPALFYSLRDERDVYEPVNTEYPADVDVYGAKVYADASIPEGTAIMVHPHATAPSLPGDFENPWHVRDPAGIVVIRLSDHV